MDSSLVLLWGLAVWRITHMLNDEEGTLDVFERLRALLAFVQTHSGGVYDMVSCFFCLSVWVAVVPSIFLADNIGQFLGYTFAISAVAIIIKTVIDRLNKI